MKSSENILIKLSNIVKNYPLGDGSLYRALNNINVVFQSFNLLPRTTVIRNVEKPMIYAGIEKSQRHIKAKKILELLRIGDKANNLANQISGGQTQRVAIA